MIHAKEIEKIENKRKEIRKGIYIKIYEQFSRKIRQTVEFGQKQVFLSVPSFLMGCPTFDRTKAVVYLKRQLERAEFTVSQTGPFELHVSWGASSRESTREREREREREPEPEFGDLPTLANLRKAANKCRRA
jgi:hypothetical protein